MPLGALDYKEKQSTLGEERILSNKLMGEKLQVAEQLFREKNPSFWFAKWSKFGNVFLSASLVETFNTLVKPQGQ